VSLLDWIPGSSIVEAAAGVAKEHIAGQREKARAKAERKAKELDIEREVVRRTTAAARYAVLAFLFGPDVALLLPWVTAADIGAYYEALSTAQPEWRQSAKQYIALSMWGGAEIVNGGHAIARKRQQRRQAEAKGQADQGGDNVPPGGGGPR
jgi:hypothetical protein